MGLEKRIAIDIDGVLLDSLSVLNDFFNEKYNKKRKQFFVKDYFSYDLDVVWGVSKQESLEILNSFYFSNSFWKIKPLPFAEEGVRELIKKGYTLFVVTSRPEAIKEGTEEQLGHFFGKSFSEIYFAESLTTKSSLVSKGEFCFLKEIPFIFEDNPYIAKGCFERGMVVYLFNYPYNYKENFNTNHLNKKVVRVGVDSPHWIELLTYLKNKKLF